MTSVIPACAYGLANLFWFLLFSPSIKGFGNFWTTMAIAAGILTAIGIIIQKHRLPLLFTFKIQHIGAGIASALLLYGIFFAGNKLSTSLFAFAHSQIAAVYTTKTGNSPALIGALLFFWIGPAEEIFWRGFIQQRLSGRLGGTAGYITTSFLYAAVHIYSLNLMLITAALICGFFWGALFRKYNSLWPGIISHALWDVLIFIIVPIGNM